MIFTVSQITDVVIPIAKAHGVTEVHLFGSYARGTATEGSDIDLVIDLGKIRTFIQLSRFVEDIEEATGKKVDILTNNQIKEDKILRSVIEKEWKQIFWSNTFK